MVMVETMTLFFQGVSAILNDESTSLEEKIERVVANYIDLLLEEPELPTFMFNEVRTTQSLLLSIPLSVRSCRTLS